MVKYKNIRANVLLAGMGLVVQWSVMLRVSPFRAAGLTFMLMT
jgi:hypothetical protein